MSIVQILIIVDKFYVSSLYQRSVLTATIIIKNLSKNETKI